MKKILVTGANGYIGQRVVTYALDKGYQVVACDIKNTGIDARAIFCEESILSGDVDIYKNVGEPDICIHLAWQDGFSHNAESHMMNLSKHYEFLINLINSGCENIAVMGSMHEIGYWEGKIDANTPCNPMSMYGVAKNALRQALMLKAKEKQFRLYWLRAYYILGDDDRNHSIFTKLLEAERTGKTEFPFTSGKNKYDFIDVKQLAGMIVDAATQTEYTGVINVCSGEPVALGDKVEQFIREKHLSITLKYGAFPDRIYDSPVVYGDNSIIKKIEER